MFEIEEFPEKWEPSQIELYYLISSFSIIVISYIMLLFPPTDANSVRYMLSTLVQSEAAIIAVVVSLSLLGVQIVASSYSSRVIQVFKSARFFWLLIIYYILTIILSMWVLMGIRDNDFSYLWVIFSFNLGILAFLILVPYIWKVLELISPYILIDRISTKVTNESILSIRIAGERSDPIQPIIDIIIGSLEKRDEGIIIHGLNTIEDKAIFLLNTKHLEGNQDIGFILSHLSAIGKLALNRNDEYAASKIIETIGKIGSVAEDNMLLAASTKAIKMLEETGLNAAENGQSDPASQALESLSKMAEKIFKLKVNKGDDKEKYCKLASDILLFYIKIGKKAVRTKLRKVIELEITSIEHIAIAMIEQDFLRGASKSIETIEKIAEISIDLGLGQAYWDAIYSLKNIGIEASKRENDNLARSVAGNLGTLGEKVAQYFEETTPGYTEERLNEISATFVSLIDHIAEALRDIALSGVKYHIDGSVRISAEEIFNIRLKSLKILKDYPKMEVDSLLNEYLEQIKVEAQSSPSSDVFRDTIKLIEWFSLEEGE
jgi:hypothetical protein